ncbi:MAG: lipopolysaccharide biosynthesis protein [Thalassobaculaceae bacterium]
MRAILSSAGLYALAILAGKGVSFVMLPVVTGHLSPDEYGALELLVAMADVGSLVLAMGLADALFRFGKEPGMPAALLGGSLVLGAAMLAAGQLAVPAVAAVVPQGVREQDLRILAATLALTASIQVPLAYLRFRDRPAVFAAVSIAKAAGQAGVVALLLVNGFGVTGVLLGGLIADAVAAVVLVALQIRDGGLSFDMTRMRRVLPYGLPLVVSGLFGFCLGSLDRWFLAAHVPVADLALYGLAAKFGLLAALAMQPFEMWWFPRRLRMLDDESGRNLSARAVALGLSWAAVCASGVAVVGPVAISWLTPSGYHAAGQWVPWLALIACLHAATNLLNAGCYAGQTTYRPMAINGAAAVVAVIGYALLIPAFGVAGTVAATIVAQVVRLIAFTVASQMTHRIPHRFLRLATVPVTAICLIVLVNVLKINEIALLAPALVAGMAVAVGLVPLRRTQWALIDGD